MRKGRLITAGEYDPDKKIFYKKVIPAKHFFRIVDGYGISYEAFLNIKSKGCKKVLIKEKGGFNWSSDLKTWEDSGKVADFGSGKQFLLSLKFMHKI